MLGKASGDKEIATHAGNGVRYVLPQTVRSTDSDVSLFLRVTQPYGRVRFVVEDEEQVLATATRLRAAPGEMEKLTIKQELLATINGEITVSLEEV